MSANALAPIRRTYGLVSVEIRTPVVRMAAYVGGMTDATAHKPVLDLIILDCPDALKLGRFYADLLGWPMEEGSDRDWATLVPPGGGVSPDNLNGRPALAFQRIDDWVAPTWPGGDSSSISTSRWVTSTRPNLRYSLWVHAGTITSRPRMAGFGSTSIPPDIRSVSSGSDFLFQS